MPIGWIDFSKSDREKISSILDMLGEKATLDELGIAPIRDGFADIFSPVLPQSRPGPNISF